MSVAFLEGDIVLRRVVVYLYEPATGDRIAVCLVVCLLVYVHAMRRYAHVFCKEIESHVLTVEHEFDGACARCPTQPERFADEETCRHLEETEIIVCIGH